MFLGIDFGTSNSSAALMIGDRPRLVKEPVKQGYSFPSSIYLTEEGEILVGQIAENRKFLDLTRYRREFKKDLLQNTPYFLGSQGEYEFTPQELITEVIKTLKKEAEKITTSLGRDSFTNAVVTIPASYKKNKQDLMKEAARKAGFTSVELLEEPVAAAIYYNHQNPATFQEGDVILIYDLGGGTFDATLIEKIGNSFQILGQPVGIENCGGINFERAIFEHLKSFYNTNQNGLSLIDKNQKNLLLDFCRDIKHQFSSYTNAAGQIPISGQTYQLAASDFNRAIDPYIEQTLDICKNLIKSVGLETKDISQVLMVGGSCRIPYIQENIKERLQTSVLLIDEPELAVCQGAVIYGYKPTAKQTKNNIVLPYQPPKESFDFAKNIKIATLGVDCVGKTSFLLALYSSLAQGINNYTLSAEDWEIHDDFCSAWKNLVEEQWWPCGTSQNTLYSFDFSYKSQKLTTLNCMDHKGGALFEPSSSACKADLISYVKDSDCLWIFVSGRELTEEIVNDRGVVNHNKKSRVTRKTGAIRIINFVYTLLGSDKFNKSNPYPISIIITQFDRCIHRDKNAICRDIKELFSLLFSFDYCFLTTIIPVSIGKGLVNDSFKKDIKISPVNVHLPLMFSIYIELQKMLLLNSKSQRQTEVIIKQMNLLYKEVEKISVYYGGDEVEIKIDVNQVNNYQN